MLFKATSLFVVSANHESDIRYQESDILHGDYWRDPGGGGLVQRRNKTHRKRLLLLLIPGLLKQVWQAGD